MSKSLLTPQSIKNNEWMQWFFIIVPPVVLVVTIFALRHQMHANKVQTELNQKQLDKIKEQEAIDHNRT